MSIGNLNTFADHFPESCPPLDSQDASGTYFRLFHSDPPSEAQFKSHAELNIGARYDACQRCGLSIFQEVRDAVSTYQYFAQKHGVGGTGLGKLVGELRLEPEHGKTKHTPRNGNSHHTWWIYEETDRPSSYDRIVEDASNALDA